MLNKLWKLKGSRFLFVVGVCLVTDKFQVSQGSENDKLPAAVTDGVLSSEKIEEYQEVEEPSIGSSEIVFVDDRNSMRPWVPKCCGLNYGFTFENKSQCVETDDEFLPDFEDRTEYYEIARNLPVKTRYEYYIGDPCLDGKYILDLTTYPDDKYLIYSNGTLLYLDQLYSKEEFCLETLNGTIRAFICFGVGKPDYEMDFTFIIYAIGLLISIPFLLATALIHLCVDMFRDLRGKSLSCHVLCLATGYLVLAIVQLASDQLDEAMCVAAGFIIQFCFVASFFWLNVICYDTWRCINNDFRCTHLPPSLRSEKIIFCKYSMYGWYAPVILSIITIIMDLEPAIPESYLKPNFGLQSCWFYSDGAALPYFYGPVAVVIFVNIVFFVLSARKIYLEQRKQKENLSSNRNSLREAVLSIRIYTNTLQECFYLFLIMGINWAAEVISWAIGGSKAIWLVTDIFNALQGIMIFYLFVLRPFRVRNEMKRRLGLIRKKIIKCSCRNEEDDQLDTRQLHEIKNGNWMEQEKFLSRSNITSV